MNYIKSGKVSALRYNMDIEGYSYVQDFIEKIDSMTDKSFEWKEFIKQVLISNGLDVYFIESASIDDERGKGYIYDVLMGLTVVGTLERAGTVFVKDIDELQRRYENNPDFIFKLQWENPKEEIIMDFLEDLLQSDMR